MGEKKSVWAEKKSVSGLKQKSVWTEMISESGLKQNQSSRLTNIVLQSRLILFQSRLIYFHSRLICFQSSLNSFRNDVSLWVLEVPARAVGKLTEG